MNKKKKILIVLSVLALLGIAGWQHWEYHHNTPVALVSADGGKVFPLKSISSILGARINLESGHQETSIDYVWIDVVNRQNEKMNITPQEALVLSQ